MGHVELHRSALGSLDSFALGGQAKLYRVPDLVLQGEKGPFVFKEYKPQAIEGRREAVRSGLRTLCRLRSEAAPMVRVVLDKRTAWPLATVVDGCGPVGCLMQEVPSAFYRVVKYSTGKQKRVPLQWEMYLQEPSAIRERKLPLLSDSHLTMLFARTLRTISVFHEELDVVIGDLSPANILLAVDGADVNKTSLIFVDVDGFRSSSVLPAIPQGHSPGWETPEHSELKRRLARSKSQRAGPASTRALLQFQDKASDVYKAALLILRTLDGEAGATQRRGSEAAVRRLERLCGRAGARTVLNALSKDPSERPGANELAGVFVR